MLTQERFLIEVITGEGFVATDRLVERLHVTRGELANAFGLSRDAVSKTARLRNRATQARLRDVVEIINRVQGWAGSVPQAFAWYRSQPLPSFGDKTAEDLVKEGRAEAVKRYLSRIAEGGYA
ncbi:antitoxin Xre/MbcA/ParS toxin-binding domain-containing protein [Geminicoccaceae bacterium 1502E]|nr:antitoxin Xre/MbcA/ParS toxin-binding domain-containing protein [Geminicoccaceae bacterium 1502E]